MPEPDLVFAFDESGDLTVFRSLADAQAAVDAHTLREPHLGLYLADGRAIRLRGGVLLVSDDIKLYDLERRLAACLRHLPLVPQQIDVVAVGRLWLERRSR